MVQAYVYVHQLLGFVLCVLEVNVVNVRFVLRKYWHWHLRFIIMVVACLALYG